MQIWIVLFCTVFDLNNVNDNQHEVNIKWRKVTFIHSFKMDMPSRQSLLSKVTEVLHQIPWSFVCRVDYFLNAALHTNGNILVNMKIWNSRQNGWKWYDWSGEILKKVDAIWLRTNSCKSITNKANENALRMRANGLPTVASTSKCLRMT